MKLFVRDLIILLQYFDPFLEVWVDGYDEHGTLKPIDIIGVSGTGCENSAVCIILNNDFEDDDQDD